jgi:DNA polymerase-3 subunit epsilon
MRVVVFDTETTALVENRTLRLDRQPEVIEFCAIDVDLDTGEVYDEFSTLVKPRLEITEFTTSKTTIDNSMVAAAPLFSEIVNGVTKILESQITIAHNLSFDRNMIEIEIERLGEKQIQWRQGLCTVEQTMFVKGRRLSLSDLHEYLFGVKFSGAHRADVDVRALVKCCIELRKREVI